MYKAFYIKTNPTYWDYYIMTITLTCIIAHFINFKKYMRLTSVEHFFFVLNRRYRYLGISLGILLLIYSKPESNNKNISVGNSIICCDIWHKYHEWYFKIVIREMSRVVFMPKITCKSCYYLFIPLPAKGCNFHM